MRSTTRRLALIVRYLGPRWVLQRARFTLQHRLGWFRWRTPARPWSAVRVESPAPATGRTPRFFFSPEDFPRWRPLLEEWDRASGGLVTNEADAILRGRIRLFGGAERDLGDPPAWHRDPVTGSEWPREAHWSRIGDFDHGDIKLVWEASRFSWVFPLVRAFARTGDVRYAEGFWRLFESWLDANPPHRGVHWKCGQETALRALAVVFATRAFEAALPPTAERRAALLRFIVVSAERIEAHIAYALSQQNNHGISEAVGLFTLGILFPECARAARWRRRGRRLVESQVRSLFYEDGAFAQHSTNYERLALEAAVWAFRLGELNHEPLAADVARRLAAAVRFLHALQDDATGELPVIGHDDGALLLPLSSAARRDCRPALQAAHALLAKRRLYAHGPWDEELLWLGGAGALAAADDTGAGAGPRGDLDAPAGGCFTLRSRDALALLRVPRYRHRPSHADLLHVDLWWRGANVALDAGTFSYNAPPPWDTPLARAARHNTVTVDGREPMERAGRFLWLPWARATLLHRAASDDGAFAYLEAEHDGYARAPSAVRHRRALLRLADDAWLVVDELRGMDEHEHRLHWLLADAPHLFGRPDDATATVELDLPAGSFRVEARSLDADMTADLVRGDADSARGWRTTTYGERAPALSLACEARGRRVRFVTLLAPASTSLALEGHPLRITGAETDTLIELGERDAARLVERVGREDKAGPG